MQPLISPSHPRQGVPTPAKHLSCGRQCYTAKLTDYPFLIDFVNIITNHKSVSTPCQPNPIFCTIMIIYHQSQKLTLLL